MRGLNQEPKQNFIVQWTRQKKNDEYKNKELESLMRLGLVVASVPVRRPFFFVRLNIVLFVSFNCKDIFHLLMCNMRENAVLNKEKKYPPNNNTNFMNCLTRKHTIVTLIVFVVFVWSTMTLMDDQWTLLDFELTFGIPESREYRKIVYNKSNMLNK